MKVVIGRNPHFTIAGAFTNPLEALAKLPELRPDEERERVDRAVMRPIR